jgi:type IV secretion system protein VirB8
VGNAKDMFEADLILGPRRRERIAYVVAGVGIVIGLTGFLGAVSILPLKTVQTHVVIVDKTSGQLDRVAAVQNMTLDENDAIIQAHLVSYVDQRETYDLADSEHRINAVLDRSDGDAARTLRDLWDSAHDDYPITVYGPDAKIDVVIRSVNQLGDGVAQVRFTKTLRLPRDKRRVTRGYVATIAFEFRPETKQRLQEVWGNPLGFVVVSYRTDAETLEN